MKKFKYLLVVVFCSLSFSVFGQTRQSLYEAYIKDDMSYWASAITKLEGKRRKTDADRLNLIDYEYIYIQYCIKKDKDSEVKLHLNKIEGLIGQLEQKKYKLPLLYAYKSATIGFRISLTPYKAPSLGSKSSGFAEKSVEMDNNNYFGYIQLGNIAFYKPSIFGGSKKEALKQYLKAYNLIKNNKTETTESWNYLNLLAMLVKTYDELENYDEAKKYCKIALDLEPNYQLVKNELYPQILKKTKK